MDVRFYDFNFNLIYIESLFKSVYWSLAYNGIGTFEMYVSPNSKLCDIALENKYIIAVQGDRQAVITTKHFEDEKLILYGRTVNFLLSKKVVFPFAPEDFESQDGIDMVKSLVAQYFPNAETVCDTESAGESSYYAQKPVNLFEAVSGILGEKGLGHKLYFDVKNKKWIFEVLKGEEKELMLSESLLNMYAFEKDDSILDMAVGGYYYQPITYVDVWHPATNTPPLSITPENYGKGYVVGSSGAGLGGAWIGGTYMICKDIDGTFTASTVQEEGFYKYIGEETEGISRFECFVNADSYEDAKKEIEQRKKESSVTAKVKNVKFGVDYFLGDVVRLNKKIGGKVISEKMRITGISIWQENANEGEMPVFSEYKEEE